MLYIYIYTGIYIFFYMYMRTIVEPPVLSLLPCSSHLDLTMGAGFCERGDNYLSRVAVFAHVVDVADCSCTSVVVRMMLSRSLAIVVP